ncbi:hypothetical protein ZIOFF_010170 [Zingiber officinale]|uniref:Calcium load-activated calcium channel n=1 Tax=Zingiber officinale TaxID=94328 RepID=A0A8J5LRY2_ZINOF|nr:hypothetical protein ZIOFF_010170 [Zingiber officinale]
MSFFPAFRYGDSLAVVGISIATAFICELISWVLIYRTSNYKALRSSIDKASKKLDSMKSSSSSSSSKKPASSSAPSASSSSSRAKKMDRVETSLKDATRDLSLSKFKSGAVVAAVLFIAFGLLNSLFEGRVVAKLPFRPVPLVLKMSHRGLSGTDPTDCSMVFMYFLCSISIRTNLQKLLGLLCDLEEGQIRMRFKNTSLLKRQQFWLLPENVNWRTISPLRLSAAVRFRKTIKLVCFHDLNNKYDKAMDRTFFCVNFSTSSYRVRALYAAHASDY